MRTVIGVFDDRSSAAHALEILGSSGFDSDAVQLQGRPFVSEPAGQPPEPDVTDDGVFGALSKFISSIFGEHGTAQSDVYTEAVRRGGYVVTVDASDDEEAEEVEAVLADAGAIDIDERVATWKAEGWRGSVDGASGEATSDWHGSGSPKGGL